MEERDLQPRFIKGSTDYKQCPQPDKPEIAFAGRSNVGKSSLINMLINRKKLAKISSTPGKTLEINHFDISNQWYLVDLPGYGYAKVSKSQRRQLDQMIKNYFLHRENMYCVMLLIDSRHEPQNVDLELMTWLGEHAIPFAIVFTKADKQSGNKLQKNLALYKKVLSNTWEVLPDIFITSALKKEGREELLNYIDDVIHNRLQE
jgi:GTP-binding protein